MDRLRRALRALQGERRGGQASGGDPLIRAGTIPLPPHAGPGGFDHAAVHARAGRLYVAHTANGALDVVDTRVDRFVGSVEGLTGAAGALVAEEQGIVFTSNRGEDTVSVLEPGIAFKVAVGVKPNGLAYDPGRRLLLAANVGEPPSASLVSLDERKEIARVPMPGRTRWAIFDPLRQRFLIAIADPCQISWIDSAEPDTIGGVFDVPAAGPHGLDLDVERRRLYCACDEGTLVILDADSGAALARRSLSGPPDVVFLDLALQILYVAVGRPGVIDLFDTVSTWKLETFATQAGAHTFALDPRSHRVYSFLPETHEAAVFRPTV